MAAEMEIDAQMEIITRCYNELEGQEFTGSYLRKSQIGDVIAPAVGDPIRSKLVAIQEVAQGKVLKGFTNSLDSKFGKDWDYRFFVDLDRAGIQNPKKFRINKCEKHTIKKSQDYTFGVKFSLKLTAIAVKQ